MKAYTLKKLLGDTDFIVHAGWDEHLVAVSNQFSWLITVDAKTRKILLHDSKRDAGKKGRDKILEKPKLLAIWDKLQELIDDGTLEALQDGVDIIESAIPVYCCIDGKMIEKLSPTHQWPSVSNDGELMGDGKYFTSKKEALESAIRRSNDRLPLLEEKLTELTMKIKKTQSAMEREKEYLNSYRNIQTDIIEKA